MRRIGTVGIVVCAFLGFFSSNLLAEIKFGHFTLLPEIAFQEAYRSNLYQTGSDRKSDYVTTITPGLGLNYYFGRNSLDLGYKVGFLNFAEYSENNYQDHRAKGLLKVPTVFGLELVLEDDFTSSTYEKTAVTDRQRRYHENVFTGALSYGFADRWKVEAKYNRDALRFGSSIDRFSQYTGDLYGMSLYYRFLPRLSGLVEYDYVTKTFDGPDTSDYTEQIAYAGVAFDPKGKLKGSFKAGYGWKDFDTKLVGRDNSRGSWVMAGQLTHDYSSKTSLALDARRAFLDDSAMENASYTDTAVRLGFQHFFTGKIGGLGFVSFRQADYDQFEAEPVTGAQKKRKDTTWTFGGGGLYNIQKWLQTRLEYEYINNDSNFLTYSYTDHRAILKIIFSR